MKEWNPWMAYMRWLCANNPRMDVPNYVGLTVAGIAFCLAPLGFLGDIVEVIHGEPLNSVRHFLGRDRQWHDEPLWQSIALAAVFMALGIFTLVSCWYARRYDVNGK